MRDCRIHFRTFSVVHIVSIDYMHIITYPLYNIIHCYIFFLGNSLCLVCVPSVQGSASEDEHAETMSEAVTTHAGPKPIDPNSAMDSTGGRSDPATADMLKALHS